MPSNIFANLGDIKGESLDSKHKHEIEVLSYSWGVTNSAPPASAFFYYIAVAEQESCDAIDIFAKLTDIKGESLDSKHKDEIEVLSYSWGVANSVPPAAAEARGRARRPSTTFPSCTTSTRRLPR